MNGIESILENPVMLIAPPAFILIDDVPKKYYLERLKRFIRIYDTLKSEAGNVKVLGSKEDNESTHNYWKAINDFEKERPGSLIRLIITNRIERHLNIWPRDCYQIFKGEIFARPLLKSKVEELMKIIRTKKCPLKLRTSKLGEGGFIVKDKDTMLVSQKIEDDPGLESLKSKGYQIYVMPVPQNPLECQFDPLNRMTHNFHIDTEINLMSSGEDNFMLVSEAYHNRYKQKINEVKNSLNAKIHIVKERSPDSVREVINMRKLPNGKVMIPDYCSSTREFLENVLGKDKVIVVETDPVNDFSGRYGGFWCMSNFI